jgi:hypothetical protein
MPKWVKVAGRVSPHGIGPEPEALGDGRSGGTD